MPTHRRYGIAAVVGLIAVATAAVLSELFATVLFAITVAYVLTPVQRWFVGRGWSRWRASAVSATLAAAAVAAVLLPVLLVVYERRGQLVAVIRQVPDRVAVDVLGTRFVVTAGDVADALVDLLPRVALDVAVFASVTGIKFGLFAVIVFGLLVGHERARAALLAPVPPTYLPFVDALEGRARETLEAILLLQVGTAVATFALAVPVFLVLGYEFPFVLGTIAGVLQFLPVIGPILLIALLAGVHLVAGEVTAALLVFAVGGVVIGWLPDVLVRPRLARWTAALPGSLYLVGFIGGLTSLGTIGIIAGPLVVALLVEGIDQLAAEMPHAAAGDGPSPPG